MLCPVRVVFAKPVSKHRADLKRQSQEDVVGRYRTSRFARFQYGLDFMVVDCRNHGRNHHRHMNPGIGQRLDCPQTRGRRCGPWLQFSLQVIVQCRHADRRRTQVARCHLGQDIQVSHNHRALGDQ